MIVVAWIDALLAGGTGAVLRLVADGAIAARMGRDFPFGTLGVNISGALVLGLLTGLALPSNLALVVGTGAVGSYTTFSTWMFETQRLSEERQVNSAAMNVLGSLALGVAAAALGQWLGAHA